MDEIGRPLIQDQTMIYDSKGIRWNKIFSWIE